MPAYIALPHGTEDGIANRVQHQITIGMFPAAAQEGVWGASPEAVACSGLAFAGEARRLRASLAEVAAGRISPAVAAEQIAEMLH